MPFALTAVSSHLKMECPRSPYFPHINYELNIFCMPHFILIRKDMLFLQPQYTFFYIQKWRHLYGQTEVSSYSMSKASSYPSTWHWDMFRPSVSHSFRDNIVSSHVHCQWLMWQPLSCFYIAKRIVGNLNVMMGENRYICNFYAGACWYMERVIYCDIRNIVVISTNAEAHIARI